MIGHLIHLQSLPNYGLIEDIVSFAMNPEEVRVKEDIWHDSWGRDTTLISFDI
jgi:hypothetical protein